MSARTRYLLTFVAVIILAIGMFGCQTAQPAATQAPAQPTAVVYAPKTVTFIAPSKAGSGFDTTGRAVVSTLEKEKLISFAMPVQNASAPPEGIATIVLQNKNKDDMISVGSIAILLNKASGASPYGPMDTTPIAILISTNYGVLVRDDSPYKTLKDFLNDLKTQPEKTPICGGQSDDRIAYGALALAYGADMKKINYAAYAGGTEASAVLLEGSCKAEVTTVDDVIGLIESKKVRVLATSGGKRLSGVFEEVPTFKEAGVDLEWVNFRYIAGGPGMSAYAVKWWQDTLAKMVKTPTWKENLNKFRWVDIFQTTDVEKYIAAKQETVNKVAAELGLKAN